MNPVGNVTKKYSTWWMMLVTGIILILIGAYAIIEPWHTFLYVIKYIGLALVLSGAFLFIHALAIKSIPGEARWLLIESVTDLIFASVLIFNPFLAVTAFPLLIGGWIFLRGIIKILISLLLSKSLRGWIFILIIGIISVVFGLVIICFPNDRGNGIGLVMSIFAILIGITYIYDAFRFKRMEDTLIALM